MYIIIFLYTYIYISDILDIASRICQSDGTWDEDINVANCESVEFRDLIVKVSVKNAHMHVVFFI